MWPYSENPIRDMYGRTRNWRDALNIFDDAHGPEAKYDPVFRLHLLGGIINQGLIGYITIVSPKWGWCANLFLICPSAGRQCERVVPFVDASRQH